MPLRKQADCKQKCNLPVKYTTQAITRYESVVMQLANPRHSCGRCPPRDTPADDVRLVDVEVTDAFEGAD